MNGENNQCFVAGWEKQTGNQHIGVDDRADHLAPRTTAVFLFSRRRASISASSRTQAMMAQDCFP